MDVDIILFVGMILFGWKSPSRCGYLNWINIIQSLLICGYCLLSGDLDIAEWSFLWCRAFFGADLIFMSLGWSEKTFEFIAHHCLAFIYLMWGSSNDILIILGFFMGELSNPFQKYYGYTKAQYRTAPSAKTFRAMQWGRLIFTSIFLPLRLVGWPWLLYTAVITLPYTFDNIVAMVGGFLLLVGGAKWYLTLIRNLRDSFAPYRLN